MTLVHPASSRFLLVLSVILTPLFVGCGTGASATPQDRASGSECASPPPDWLWCDDFTVDRLSSYFEYDDADGSFVREEDVGVDGSHGMRARFRNGQVSAGSLKLAVGATPQRYFAAADDGRTVHRELYWRFYVRYAPEWRGGGGDKLTRATVFSDRSSWAQAMIAHVWSGSPPHQDVLVLDPATGVGGPPLPAVSARGSSVDLVRTTAYNDFDNLDWLGIARGTTPIFADDRVGRWYCIEVGVRLNEPGEGDGTFTLRIDGELEARAEGLNWVGSYDEYGINAIFLENYWNDGAPADQERYFDHFVVSTAPIGCLERAEP